MDGHICPRCGGRGHRDKDDCISHLEAEVKRLTAMDKEQSMLLVEDAAAFELITERNAALVEFVERVAARPDIARSLPGLTRGAQELLDT